MSAGWLPAAPTQPGYYWVQPASGGMQIVFVVQQQADASTVLPGLRAVNYTPASTDRWFGPLDQPALA